MTKKKTDDKTTELTESLKRLQAEFENFKKRTEKENIDRIKYSNAQVLGKLLPVLDNFELSLKNCDDTEHIKGVRIVFAQLNDVLKEEGLNPIEAVGQTFDPHLHEALLQEKSDNPENTIIEELQKGYKLYEKVLRHTKVKVSK